MSLLRQRILTSAIRFFAEKGFASTSIQDIANDCGIAKGSLYKIFSSKEDLLIEVFEFRFQNMREQAELIRNELQLLPLQRLARETLLQLEFMAEFKFSIQDAQELQAQEGTKLGLYLSGIKAKLMNYYGDCLVHGLGENIAPYKWDLISVYVGMMKQYTMFGHLLNNPLDPIRLSSYVVDRIEEIAVGLLRKEPQPLFDDSVVKRFIHQTMEGTQTSNKNIKSDLLQQMEMAVNELVIPLSSKTELMDAVIILREQLTEELPRAVLVRAMLDFLSKQHELATYTGQLERILGCELRKASKNNI
jgi:AcrR family transcriptional regulator